MKANELRIGNKVKYDGRVFKIHSLSEEYPTLNTIEFGIGVVDWNSLEPIQLTEEWLLMLGFKPLQKDWQKKGLIIHTRKRGFIVRKSIPQIHHVHQLQNLHYALTGEELTLTETT
jgi:hypothetical protein